MFRVLASLAAVASSPLVVTDFTAAKHDQVGSLGASAAAKFTAATGAARKYTHPTLCDAKMMQHSGHVPFKAHNGGDESYFFWAFEASEVPASEAPLVMWLTGGPGCSSMMALMTENGPCNMMPSGEIVHNKYAWNRKANMLWLDQPAGVGFSGGKHIHDEKQVGFNVVAFLHQFLTDFPQFANNDLVITGESYGGHYVPMVAHAIVQANAAGDGPKLNLKAIGVGNGLTDPGIQYQYYPEMALNGGKAEGGSLEHGVVDKATYEEMKAAVPKCVALIEMCNAGKPSQVCADAQQECGGSQIGPYQETGMNVYDMRIKCQVPGLCYDFSAVTSWFNSAEVQEQLGVHSPWVSCNMLVNAEFSLDWMLDVEKVVPGLLEAGVQVMIYAGDVDFICNWLGNKHWVTESIEWEGKEEFAKAADLEWSVDGKVAGRVRVHKNLSFVQVYQAGHMVPMDQPAAAGAMFDALIAGKTPAPDAEEITG